MRALRLGGTCSSRGQREASVRCAGAQPAAPRTIRRPQAHLYAPHVHRYGRLALRLPVSAVPAGVLLLAAAARLAVHRALIRAGVAGPSPRGASTSFRSASHTERWPGRARLAGCPLAHPCSPLATSWNPADAHVARRAPPRNAMGGQHGTSWRRRPGNYGRRWARGRCARPTCCIAVRSVARAGLSGVHSRRHTGHIRRQSPTRPPYQPFIPKLH